MYFVIISTNDLAFTHIFTRERVHNTCICGVCGLMQCLAMLILNYYIEDPYSFRVFPHCGITCIVYDMFVTPLHFNPKKSKCTDLANFNSLSVAHCTGSDPHATIS